MKKLFLFGTMCTGTLLSGQLIAQSVKSSLVPMAAATAMSKKYPEAKKVTWEKENGNFEANWGGKSGEDMSVQFKPNGSFVEQVEAMQVSVLPAMIVKYVQLHYKGAKITEAGKVTNAAGKIMYEAEVKHKDLLFDEQGNFLKID